MQEIAAQFLTGHPEFDRDDVSLMLCCLTGRAPLSEEEETIAEHDLPQYEDASPQEVSDLDCGRWLEELQALPPDAPQWERVPEFIEAVQQLAEEKRQAREGKRDNLRRALATLREHGVDALTFFAMADVAHWTAETCPLADVEALSKEVEQLQALLLRHSILRHSLQLPWLKTDSAVPR